MASINIQKSRSDVGNKNQVVVWLMHSLTLIGLAVIIFLIAGAFLFYSRAKQSRKADITGQNQEPQPLADDPGEAFLWEIGQNRPIIDTQQPNPTFGRRTFFQKMATGALASVAGWVAVRAANTLLAEQINPGKTAGKLPSGQEKSGSVAQNSHNDDHHDNHNDDGHYDTESHTDDHGDSGWEHSSSHYDNHTDREPHSDGHNDNSGHSDYHGDSGAIAA